MYIIEYPERYRIDIIDNIMNTIQSSEYRDPFQIKLEIDFL